jgi:hypothetical protein
MVERARGVKKTATKKTATKKTAAKKTAAKKTAAASPARKATTKKAAKKAAARTGATPKYPRHSVERALRIPKAVYEKDADKPVTYAEAASYVGAAAATGNLGLEIASARKYGFFDSGDDGKLVLTDRARRAIAPQSPTDRTQALQEAVLAAPDLSEVYSSYRGELIPDAEYFRNALVDRFHIPSEKLDEFLTIFNESVRSAGLVDESGDRPMLIDVGRDESHQPVVRSRGGSGAKVKVEPGSTCFVMQPFAAPLGGYYETIFKPAIEQAGMTAMRADAEIFGTGKVIDQIWRGINSAKVLVAELTTKNANVFYELGLAHALNRPVVLVSSNEEDVPFDLHHIRVIYYDVRDPFWGEKLIDKVADNIKSALANPEEAIFKIEESAAAG